MEKANALKPLLVQNALRLAYPISEDDLKTLYKEQTTIRFFAYSSMIDKTAFGFLNRQFLSI